MLSRGYALTMFVLAAAPAAAQSTGTPVFQSPYRAFSYDEASVTFSDPGAGFALEGSYRTGFPGGVDGAIRGGLADGGTRGSGRLLLGVDGRLRVIDHTDGFPLDGSLTLGLGFAAKRGQTAGYLPIGLTVGRRFNVEGSTVSLVPYAHAVLTPMFGDASGVAFTLGLGTDLRLNPHIDLRISAGLGDRDGLALSVAFLR